jgi:RimJ/RimL family protein N-acetyltransferase
VCGPEDAALLRAAIDNSLDHLRKWLPWAMKEPVSLDDTRARLAQGRTRFEAGEDFQYAVFTPHEDRIVGGAGLHRRSAPGSLEIGYWIHADHIGQGLATEVVRALTLAGLSLPGVERIQIDCDPKNHRSRRVPDKLGYRTVALRRANKLTPLGEPRDTVVYEISSLTQLSAERDRSQTVL